MLHCVEQLVYSVLTHKKLGNLPESFVKTSEEWILENITKSIHFQRLLSERKDEKMIREVVQAELPKVLSEQSTTHSLGKLLVTYNKLTEQSLQLEQLDINKLDANQLYHYGVLKKILAGSFEDSPNKTPTINNVKGDHIAGIKTVTKNNHYYGNSNTKSRYSGAVSKRANAAIALIELNLKNVYLRTAIDDMSKLAENMNEEIKNECAALMSRLSAWESNQITGLSNEPRATVMENIMQDAQLLLRRIKDYL